MYNFQTDSKNGHDVKSLGPESERKEREAEWRAPNIIVFVAANLYTTGTVHC